MIRALKLALIPISFVGLFGVLIDPSLPMAVRICVPLAICVAGLIIIIKSQMSEE